MERSTSKAYGWFFMAMSIFGPFGMAHSQPQTTLTFTAASDGVHIPLDSVLVVNLTQGGDTVLYAPDTLLVLDITTGLGADPFDGQPLSIRPPFPNPFDGSTRFQVGTTEPGQMVLTVYDLTGRVVVSMQRSVVPGVHSFTYQGGRQGMLLLVAEANGRRSVERMLAMPLDGSSASTLTYEGAGGMYESGRPKDLGPFYWATGDSLKYSGYVTHAPVPLGFDSLSSGSVPSFSQTITFPFVTLSDTLSAADLAILDALPDTILLPESILIDDTLTAFDILSELDSTFIDSLGFGMAPLTKNLLPATEQKHLLFARMAVFAWFLIDDGQHTYPAEGPNSPAQDGLAYSYGGKYYSIRRKPTAGQCTVDSIYGLDCSGMIYNMGEQAHLTFPLGIGSSNVAAMTDTSYWRKALEPEYDKLGVVDMGLALPIDSMRSGDVILWGGHVGQVFIDGTADKYIYQSNGTSNANGNCATNSGQGRGPSMKPLQLNWLEAFGSSYRVFRIKEKGCDDDAPTVTDIDGNTYEVVSVGNQCWMAENLKTTQYRDGTLIPNVTDGTAWSLLNSGAWCNYDNISAYDAIYGKLYNWYAAANPNICPQGWHMPTDAEWTVLITYLGGEWVAGGKMKATTLWNAPNTGATNESGFSGLPGAYRSNSNGNFASLGSFGYWWSASESGAESAWFRNMGSNGAGVGRGFDNEETGFCLRCVRD